MPYFPVQAVQNKELKATDTAISWSTVSNAIPDRNNKDCRIRWYKLTGAKKGFWSASEDKRLVDGVQKHSNQWALVAKVVETRNADRRCYRLVSFYLITQQFTDI